MNILLFGYGKMGKAIEKLSLERGHHIALTIDKEETDKIDEIEKYAIDIAIEFSEPKSAFNNIKTCLEIGVPVVSGTTGWLDKFTEITTLCQQKDGAFFYASNYSVGVNIFFKLNEYLAKLMSSQQYGIKMSETHHTEKKDAPSGTAISIAEDILKQHPQFDKWALDIQKPDTSTIPITSYRETNVPGTHKVTYHSEIDDITIKHKANSRKGFAMGAVLAAEWLIGKTGVFGMNDMLEF
ncbi:MAG: 4-hydroxy-tetrahydrodipicolinate reductase [Bacteroidota bacterium]